MRLFHNRPFALLCAVFIAVAVCAYRLDIKYKYLLIAVLLTVGALCALAAIFLRSRRKLSLTAVFCLLCVISAVLAAVSQILFIDRKREEQKSYIGERSVGFVVIGEEYVGEYSTEYLVHVERIDSYEVDFYTSAVTAFADCFDVGDRVYARATVADAGDSVFGYSYNRDGDRYVQLVLRNEESCALLSSGNTDIRIFLRSMRDTVSGYVERVFGDDGAAYVKGFLIGDTSEIPAEVIRDFRRSGVSHILAVSGLHISVIIGALELLLRKLGVKRGVRVVVLSASALAFLAITGFSLSACRSVVMLWIVYVCYLYVKEHDSVTTLFSAVALIMLLNPFSVSDIGLWLSFLATLGIVSVYQPLYLKIISGRRNGVRGRLIYILKKIFLAVLMTFICNSFICFVVWRFFGEISAISLISNPILSPISSVFMLLSFVLCLFGAIPILRLPIRALTLLFCRLIEALVGAFSRMSGAVISLRYPFAKVIIIAMTVAIVVMLLIRLRRKWMMLLPPTVAAAMFVACFALYSALHAGEISVCYYSEGKNELITASSGYSATLIDISSGSYSFLYSARELMAQGYATEVSEYVLTHYHASHVMSAEKLMRSVQIRSVCLPYPKSEAELGIMRNIMRLADRYGALVSVYYMGDTLALLDGKGSCNIFFDESSDIDAACILIKSENERFGYITPSADFGSLGETAELIAKNSEHLVIGAHVGADLGRYSFSVEDGVTESVFYSSDELFSLSDIPLLDYVICVADRRYGYAQHRVIIN